MAQANGSAPEAAAPSTKGPAVIGINFGNTYASIAVLTKEGHADCIANEDGERQIACAVSFHGEEIYIGNQAKPQLVKNAENTIVGFRNLLGKKFSEIPKDQPITSAPVIQHPEQPDAAAYKVAILQPAPTPIAAPTPSVRSVAATPAASHLPTPRSEPTPAERVLTVTEVASIFLKSLVQSAQDFLGRKVEGAVIAIPSWFDESARAALEEAAKEAEIDVLQYLDEASAASLISVTSPAKTLDADRNTLLVDLGQSALSLSLLSIRHGLVYSIASSYDTSVNGEQIDVKLLKYFAKDFTKKTKIPLQVCPAKDKADQRAEAKLRLALEHTKRTISASSGAASCSVESMKDGMDFNTTVNRMRFDLECRSVYTAVVAAATRLLESVGFEPIHVDEIIYVGGSASLPGLDETFFTNGFPESVVTPFTEGSVLGGGSGDPTSLLARGCALQAKVLAGIPADQVEIREAFKRGSEHASVHATSKTLGIILPEDVSEGDAKAGDLGGQWVLGVPKETPLPYRRIVQFDCDLGEGTEGERKVGMDLWEVSEGVKVENIKQSKEEPEEGEEDEEEEEEEEEEIREKTLTKETQLGSLQLSCKHPIKEKGRWKTTVEVQFVVGHAGGVILTAREIHKDGKGEPTTLTIHPVSQS
ncbi:actin-like ATPase domain-containing protein [Schizopora paradoxa]|uniref:Actin-like ATPase domain-containing protein n=1 Tax=Schizopora paradoxa TaxID=27342 RepID=A0A0H2SD58_9AGAM|nr:actin-like ATPase domain-containing protein [Schizopora paradoxa]